jgi:hypothetical protein
MLWQHTQFEAQAPSAEARDYRLKNSVVVVTVGSAGMGLLDRRGISVSCGSTACMWN